MEAETRKAKIADKQFFKKRLFSRGCQSFGTLESDERISNLRLDQKILTHFMRGVSLYDPVIHLPLYLFTYLPTYLLTYLLTYLPTYLPTFLLTYLPTYLLKCYIVWWDNFRETLNQSFQTYKYGDKCLVHELMS